MSAAYFTELQTQIIALSRVYSPEFLRIALNVFVASAVYKMTMTGWQIAFRGGSIEDNNYLFGTTVFQIAVGWTLLTFYDVPVPGLGYSFSGLIIDTMAAFVHILDASIVVLAITTLDSLLAKFVGPGWSFLAQAIYYTIWVLVMLARMVTLAIVGFSLFAQAVLVLVGPLFVSLFLVPHFRRYFFGWMDSLIQWSFLQVTAYAYMFVGVKLLASVTTKVPNGLTSNDYLTYGAQVVVFLLIYLVGFAMIPSLNASIFSGSASTQVVNILRGRKVIS